MPLLDDFLREHLDGSPGRLRDFCVRELVVSPHVYGFGKYTGDRRFDADDCDLMREVYQLLTFYNHALMDANAWFWEAYRTPSGFRRYVSGFFLEDYLAPDGSVIAMPQIYWWKRGLSLSEYETAATRYLDFAERVISRRGGLIARRLATTPPSSSGAPQGPHRGDLGQGATD